MAKSIQKLVRYFRLLQSSCSHTT